MTSADRPPVPLPAFAPAEPTQKDREQVRLLSILHYIYAGILALTSLLGLIYVGMGIYFLLAGSDPVGGGPPPPVVVSWLILLGGAAVVVLGWVLAGFTVWAARCLGRHEKRRLCIVIAAFDCVNTPLGTLLGVFTLIVLSRPAVRTLFERR